MRKMWITSLPQRSVQERMMERLKEPLRLAQYGMPMPLVNNGGPNAVEGT